MIDVHQFQVQVRLFAKFQYHSMGKETNLVELDSSSTLCNVLEDVTMIDVHQFQVQVRLSEDSFDLASWPQITLRQQCILVQRSR